MPVRTSSAPHYGARSSVQDATTHAPLLGVQVEFLHTLALLDEPRPPDGAAPAAEVPELRAARGLFRWDVRAR